MREKPGFPANRPLGKTGDKVRQDCRIQSAIICFCYTFHSTGRLDKVPVPTSSHGSWDVLHGASGQRRRICSDGVRKIWFIYDADLEQGDQKTEDEIDF